MHILSHVIIQNTVKLNEEAQHNIFWLSSLMLGTGYPKRVYCEECKCIVINFPTFIEYINLQN
jgi:hypothetical protein